MIIIFRIVAAILDKIWEAVRMNFNAFRVNFANILASAGTSKR
jgi:hypothetical protein